MAPPSQKLNEDCAVYSSKNLLEVLTLKLYIFYDIPPSRLTELCANSSISLFYS